MRRRNLRLLVCLGALAAVLHPTRPARATTIDPFIWEQLVADAGFVGIVECETAGGIVARYRVVESWKGAPAGTLLTIRMAVNYWGPQFPVTLVGERYLVTAFRSHAPTRIISTTSGAPVPLWWRDIPADYRLPLWQGRVRLPLGAQEKPLGPLGSEHKDLESFKRAATELLSLDPEAREARVLHALTRKYLFRRKATAAELAKLTGKERSVVRRLEDAGQKILASSSPREIAHQLLGLVKQDREARYSVGAIISQGGGAATLELLKGIPATQLPWTEEERADLIEELKQRLGPPAAAEAATHAGPREQPPPAQKLAELRKALAAGPESEQFGEAFDVLTRHDSAAVADYLVRWVNPNKDWWDTDYGYVLGSYFAHACGKDRGANLQKLFAARDPFIRVAGAVYLCFESRELCLPKLEELSALPGDPGAWAALNLARRGRKEAVPRALELFASAGARGHMSGVPHENLQLRLVVLLSNSAAASGLPQPSPPPEPDYEAGAAAFKQYQESFHRHYADWWRANREKIQLRDPWLSLLEQQKVD